MTNLTQVLRYYLGCDVETERGIEKLVYAFNDGYNIAFETSSVIKKETFPWSDSNRPLLRQPSSLIKFEASQIAVLAGINAGEDDELSFEINEDEITIWNSSDYGDNKDDASDNDALVYIQLKPEFYVCKSLPSAVDTIPGFMEQVQIVHYLLQNHFDLFGLIKSGQAKEKSFGR